MKEERSKMATKTAANKPSAKELRSAAKELGIEGWEDMGRKELTDAVTAARNGSEGNAPEAAPEATKSTQTSKKSSTTKAAASKRAPKKSAPKKATGRANPDPNDPIPFRPGTNLYHIAKALMEGGKRSSLVKQLKPKLEFNPRKQSASDFNVDEEIDRRLKVIGYILRNQHGWVYEHEGRGPDAKIHVYPPS